MKYCECGCGTAAREGKRFARYHQVTNGRALIWSRDQRRYKYRYRSVMEEHIGRPLAPGECVHHKNGNTLDDGVENLELCTSHSDHMTKHHPGNRAVFPCVICGNLHRNTTRRKFHICSEKCYRKWKSPGRPVSSGTGLMLTITCRQCGKQVIRKGGGGFCSRKCYGESMAGKPGIPKRDNRIIEYKGDRKMVAEWARQLMVPYKSIANRVFMGWSDERIITQPFRKSPK